MVNFRVLVGFRVRSESQIYEKAKVALKFRT